MSGKITTQEMKDILINVSYTLEQKHVSDGIIDIFDDLFKDSKNM